MTRIYFVRHAQPNFHHHDDLTRELSAKGIADRSLVTNFLQSRQIDIVLSSPYRRAVETVSDFAEKHKLKIVPIEDFRERRVGNDWIPDFNAFCQRQWNDFSYKLTGGESLREVQDRNINALSAVLQQYRGKNIVIGSHGTAMSTIIRFYDKSFGYLDFMRIKDLMPWVVQFDFDGLDCRTIRSFDLFEAVSVDTKLP